MGSRRPETKRSGNYADALHQLESHISIPSEQVKVGVKNGSVTLEGTVDWQYQKDLAESTVHSLKGVVGITNHIEVKPDISPREIKRKIENAFRQSAELEASHIDVKVDDRTVKLYGEVRTWAEKSDAERAAWSAPGVATVENHIGLKLGFQFPSRENQHVT